MHVFLLIFRFASFKRNLLRPEWTVQSFSSGGLEGKDECVVDARIDSSLDTYAILQGDAPPCNVSYGLRPIVGTVKASKVCRRHLGLFEMLWSDFLAAFLIEMTGDMNCADLACALLHETVFWNWKLYCVNFFFCWPPFLRLPGICCILLGRLCTNCYLIM